MRRLSKSMLFFLLTTLSVGGVGIYLYLNHRYVCTIHCFGSNIAKKKAYILQNKNLPQHVAIIMDGNGRWAKKQAKPRLFGHLSAVKNVENAIKACIELNIPYLTLYTFSSENWQRPEEEVTGLMNLLRDTIKDKLSYLVENNIKLKIIGDIRRAPEGCKTIINQAINATSNNTKLTLTLCIGYGGRWEVIQAIQSLSNDIINKKIQACDITEESFVQYLSTCNVPDPDLVIRTGGDFRISNFLIWQIAYSELVVLEKYWPDFQEADFYNVIMKYQKRDRRFGKVV